MPVTSTTFHTQALQPTRLVRSTHRNRDGASKQAQQPVQNRVKVLLVHIPKLSIRGQARLAAEVGVSRSTISRLVNGRINPSYRLARGVVTALEQLIGYPLDMRDVFSTDGTYPIPSGCTLCNCTGCFPDFYYDEDDTLRPEWRGRKPGDWSLTPAADTGLSEAAGDHPKTRAAGKQKKTQAAGKDKR